MSAIAILGLGYVGLPLALAFSRSGSATKVLGYDIDAARVDALNQGRDANGETDAIALKAALSAVWY